MSKIKITINDQEIDSLDQAIKLIQEAKEKKGLWRPEKNGQYWFINGNSKIDFAYADYSGVTERNIKCDNCFKTEAEAQKELDKRKALVRIKDYIAREGIEREREARIGTILWGLGYSDRDCSIIKKACEADLKILFEV